MAIQDKKKHPDQYKVIQARAIKFKDKILKLCEQRNDDWGSAAEHRLSNCFDFVANEAVYHAGCHQRFSTPNIWYSFNINPMLVAICLLFISLTPLLRYKGNLGYLSVKKNEIKYQ